MRRVSARRSTLSHCLVGVASAALLAAASPGQAETLQYGASLAEGWRRIVGCVDRIFRGTKPGELPIYLESKFELLVNAKAARVFGVAIPTSLILRADEVIE